MDLYNKIKQAFLSVVRQDTTAYPQAISNYKGKNAETIRHSTYGVSSSPPKGSLGLLFQVEGISGVQYGIFDYIQGRFKNLTEGEVQVGNYLTQASIKFSANGDVTVDAPAGNLIANVFGDTTLTTDTLTINSTNGTIINDDLTVNGDVTASDYNTSGATPSYNVHIHTGDSGGDTGTPK